MYNNSSVPDHHNITHSRAFTLIEIMIVLVIIGITITFAVLAFGDFGQARRIKAEAERLAMIIPLAEQQAILQPAVLRLGIQQNGYQFYRYVTDVKTHHANWQLIKRDRLLAYHALPKRIALTIDKPAQQSHIVITNTGDITPFRLTIGKVGKKPLYAIIAQANGHVELIPLDDK